MKPVIKIPTLILGGITLILIIMAISNTCPPQGPWPMPPWCKSAENNTQHTTDNTQNTANNMQTANETTTTTTETPRGTPTETTETITETQTTENTNLDELFPTTIPKPTAIRKKGFQKGVIFGGMLWRPEEIPNAKYNLKQLKQFGIKWVSIIPEWFMKDEHSNTIYPFYASNGTFPNPTGWITPTLTDEELRTIIREAKKEGLHVVLKPQIDPITFGVEDVSRGAIKPQSWDKWFESYTTFITHYAKIAEEEGVELLIIGTELDTSSMSSLTNCCGAPNDAENRWRKVIQEVKKEYKGKLSYSVSCQIDDYESDWRSQCHGPRDITFWDDLDYIGFEPYFGLTNKNNPSVEELKTAFDERLDEWAKPLYNQYHKPIIFSELAFESYDGVNKKCLSGSNSGIIDHEEQADIYEAIFESIADKNYIQGTYWWAWYLQPQESTITDWKEWEKEDSSNPFNGKLSGQIIRKWYEAIED